jgi:hypothetical protein
MARPKPLLCPATGEEDCEDDNCKIGLCLEQRHQRETEAAKVELERAAFAELVELALESGIIKVELDGRITMLDHPRKAARALIARILSMPIYADRIRAHVSEAERGDSR